MVTGEIENAFLCKVVDEPCITFVFGTVVYDRSRRFGNGDWIATSPLRKFEVIDVGLKIYTRNSAYVVQEPIRERKIVWAAVDNIRLGTNPDIAMTLVNSSFNDE
jgi:hypothetical protein